MDTCVTVPRVLLVDDNRRLLSLLDGQFTYGCGIHPTMLGVLVVQVR